MRRLYAAASTDTPTRCALKLFIPHRWSPRWIELERFREHDGIDCRDFDRIENAPRWIAARGGIPRFPPPIKMGTLCAELFHAFEKLILFFFWFLHFLEIQRIKSTVRKFVTLTKMQRRSRFPIRNAFSSKRNFTNWDNVVLSGKFEIWNLKFLYGKIKIYFELWKLKISRLSFLFNLFQSPATFRIS